MSQVTEFWAQPSANIMHLDVRSKLCLPRKNYYDFSFQAMLCLAVSFVCFVFLPSGVLKLSNLGATSKY